MLSPAIHSAVFGFQERLHGFLSYGECQREGAPFQAAEHLGFRYPIDWMGLWCNSAWKDAFRGDHPSSQFWWWGGYSYLCSQQRAIASPSDPDGYIRKKVHAINSWSSHRSWGVAHFEQKGPKTRGFRWEHGIILEDQVSSGIHQDESQAPRGQSSGLAWFSVRYTKVW